MIDALDFVPAVAFVPVRCPLCRRTKPRTYSVRAVAGQRTLRYHRCQSCGARFRSIELTPETMAEWRPRSAKP